MSAFLKMSSTHSQPNRSFADTGTCDGTAARIAETISRMRVGYLSKVAPPSWRLTVAAGQPKLMSIARAPAS